MRWLYSLLMWLAQPVLWLKLRHRGRREPGYLLAPGERFGRYLTPVAPIDEPTVWVHAVSLGETRACAGLVAALRERWPGMRLLLTHGTATGRAEGARLLLPGDLQAWQPWDTPGATRRFLAHFRPQLGILIETEVWPNLVAACQRSKVPLVLVNARLSVASQRKALRLRGLSRPAYAGLAGVWAQTAEDAQRLVQLGALVRGSMGNLKYDAAPDAGQWRLGQAWRKRWAKPVLVLASSRDGEEAALLQIIGSFRSSALANQAPSAIESVFSVQWMVVPRHPQRFDAVAELIRSQGWRVSRRSAWGADGPPAGGADAEIWLGDSLGEMALYYGLADVALLGGSFEPLGGQNLIEASACGCPVVMGPHTFNFAQAAEQALHGGAAFRVDDLPQGVRRALTLATDEAQLREASRAASAFAKSHRGAVKRLADALAPMLRFGL